MKKITYVTATLSILPLVALEPVVPNAVGQPQVVSSGRSAKAPNPFATPEGILKDLTSVQQHIAKTFNQLINDFKASATPRVNQIVTNETQKQFTLLKQALRDLPIITTVYQAKEVSEELYSLSLSVINAIQAIDGNLQGYFDTFPDSQAYKEIIDDSLNKLQNAQKKAEQLYNRFNASWMEPEFGTVSKAANILSQIAKTAREKTIQVLDLVKAPKKKSKNPFKRIFGK